MCAQRSTDLETFMQGVVARNPGETESLRESFPVRQGHRRRPEPGLESPSGVHGQNGKD